MIQFSSYHVSFVLLWGTLPVIFRSMRWFREKIDFPVIYISSGNTSSILNNDVWEIRGKWNIWQHNVDISLEWYSFSWRQYTMIRIWKYHFSFLMKGDFTMNKIFKLLLTNFINYIRPKVNLSNFTGYKILIWKWHFWIKSKQRLTFIFPVSSFSEF